MPPTPECRTLTEISSCGSLAISSSTASAEPADVRLEQEVELLELAGLDLLEDVLERALAAGPAGLLLLAQAQRALLGLLAGRAVVLDDVDELTGLGHAVEAEDLDRIARHGLGHASARVVVHRADAAPVRTADEGVADLQRAALDQQRDDRAAARVELGLDDHARRLGVRVGLQVLELGDREDRVEQVLEVQLGLRGHVDELVAAVGLPVGRRDVALGHLAAHALRIGPLLVDLVDRDDDRHVGRLRVVDRLFGLRLHAVVGRDHDHGDVGDAGAARTHGGERLMARGVEERDELVAVVHLVRADVLGDATGLARGDLGRADAVEQRGLAVVDVAHDRDDRRARDEILVGVVVRRVGVGLFAGVDDLDLAVELGREDLDRLVGQRLRERRHLAEHHELLDDLRHRDAEVLRDVLDRGARLDLEAVECALGGGVKRLDGLVVRAATAPATALTARRALLRAATARATARSATRRLRIDDDATPATGRARGALAGD